MRFERRGIYREDHCFAVGYLFLEILRSISLKIIFDILIDILVYKNRYKVGRAWIFGCIYFFPIDKNRVLQKIRYAVADDQYSYNEFFDSIHKVGSRIVNTFHLTKKCDTLLYINENENKQKIAIFAISKLGFCDTIVLAFRL